MINKLKNIDWVRTMFLIPILLVATISISHVISWYSMSNPHNWAIFLSISIEIGAMTSLIAVTKKIKGGVWFMFGIVTLIQIIGNIFYSYVHIDEVSTTFQKWVELTGPLFEMVGTESTDVIPHKRWLALLEGGLLPLISLTALHFYVKYEKPETDEVPTKTDQDNDEDKIDTVLEEPNTRVRPNQGKIKGIWSHIKKLREASKSSEPYEEEDEEEEQLDEVMNKDLEDVIEFDKLEDMLVEPGETPKDGVIEDLGDGRKVFRDKDGVKALVYRKR
jgi:hypothetical protein